MRSNLASMSSFHYSCSKFIAVFRCLSGIEDSKTLEDPRVSDPRGGGRSVPSVRRSAEGVQDHPKCQSLERGKAGNTGFQTAKDGLKNQETQEKKPPHGSSHVLAKAWTQLESSCLVRLDPEVATVQALE